MADLAGYLHSNQAYVNDILGVSLKTGCWVPLSYMEST